MSEFDDVIRAFEGKTITEIDAWHTAEGAEVWVSCGERTLVIGYEAGVGMFIKQYEGQEVLH